MVQMTQQTKTNLIITGSTLLGSGALYITGWTIFGAEFGRAINNFSNKLEIDNVFAKKSDSVKSGLLIGLVCGGGVMLLAGAIMLPIALTATIEEEKKETTL
uniref:Uncharacterized protein n=1 Tax=viral metagenome TaxID=1070528 RepID=A0A6C0IK75_9ZZZZ